MARYFFNLYRDTQTFDEVGSKHADVAAVRAQAVGTMGDLIGGKLFKPGDASPRSINVTEVVGKTVTVVTAAASVETVKGLILAS